MTDIDDLISSLRMIGEEKMYQEPASTSATINRAAGTIFMLRDALAQAEEALDQILDDMGSDGLSVCQAAKNEGILALVAVRSLIVSGGYDDEKSTSIEELEAKARLIAAAPALYEALVVAAGALRDGGFLDVAEEIEFALKQVMASNERQSCEPRLVVENDAPNPHPPNPSGEG